MWSYLWLKICTTSVNNTVAANFPFNVTTKGLATINCSNHKTKLTIPKFTAKTMIIHKITAIIDTANLFFLNFLIISYPPTLTSDYPNNKIRTLLTMSQ